MREAILRSYDAFLGREKLCATTPGLNVRKAFQAGYEAAAAELQKRIGELEAERDDALESEAQATDCAKEAHVIVSRVWKALGISNYADAQGKAIDEIVADLLKSHKQQLAERREDELREDERLGRAMARAEAAEQALTAERQRREEVEVVAKSLAYLFKDSELPEYRRWTDYIARHPSSSGSEK